MPTGEFQDDFGFDVWLVEVLRMSKTALVPYTKRFSNERNASLIEFVIKRHHKSN